MSPLACTGKIPCHLYTTSVHTGSHLRRDGSGKRVVARHPFWLQLARQVFLCEVHPLRLMEQIQKDETRACIRELHHHIKTILANV